VDKKVFVRTLSFGAIFAFLPIGALALLLSRRARDGYWMSRRMLIKFEPGTDSELFLRILESAEDHRYRDHWGIDPIAIVRAIRNLLLGRRLEGASTIEQQYVRTCTGNRKISLVRKCEEVTVSILLALSSDKNDIAHSYICCAYFGEGLCGYKSVISALWSEESDSSTDLYRAAVVIAMLKRPKPIGDSAKWKIALQNRANYIVSRHIKSSPPPPPVP